MLKEKLLQDTPEIIIQIEEPTCDFTIENSVIKLSYINIESCTIRFYSINLEILFSRSPFLGSNDNNFSYTKPYKEILVNLPLGGKFEMPLPEDLCKKNIIIEVDCGTYTKSLSYYATELKTNVIEMQGIIKIYNQNNMPKPGVYVKVFAKFDDGKIDFYKDGYTDIRGKFDYVSLNTDCLKSIKKFAIFTSDTKQGSMILEASPPPQ